LAQAVRVAAAVVVGRPAVAVEEAGPAGVAAAVGLAAEAAEVEVEEAVAVAVEVEEEECPL
jgi:NADPH-dependent glutamate synthase beta subunit-like oxidoreductase